ncbi:MAG: ABC transporter permease [Nitrospinae bacterium]|nr:ABC transporter permease [Nitrospinota bacterium]MCY4382387.1 ABC transporter permease [Nitrospinota bacterium]
MTTATDQIDYQSPQRGPQWRAVWDAFSQNRAVPIAGSVLLVLVLLVLSAPLLAPYDPYALGSGSRLGGHSFQNIMGVDNLGRDVFSRILWGGRVSIFVGFSAAFATTVMGLLVGTISGYLGGWVDDILMRFTETFMVIPRFFLALIIVAFFGANIWNIIFAISILTWPVTARLVRSEFLTLRTRQFVDAAHVIGTPRSTIIFREILPNAIGVVVVNASLLTAQAMLLEAGLSYLGLGDPSLVTWGRMLYEAQPFLRQAWWMAVYPGLGIFLSVLTLNLLGDGLNDVLNPRSSEIHRTGL